MTTFTDATLAASDETVCNTIIQTKALANSVGTPKVESRCDDELIALAEELFDADKILEAFRHLQNVRNVDLLSEKHHRMCKIASECSAAISDLLSEPGSAESGWTKQGESHGHHDTVIYYKVDDGANLTCRLETPIEFSLLVPLLSVFNESNLYADWVPYWKIPKVGIRSSRQLEQIGRANQILQIIGDVPWPFSLREVMMKTVAVDEIDTRGYFAVRLHSAETGGVVPPPDPSMKRVDLKGALLFRSCPMDHPILVKSKNTTCTCTDPMILVSFKMWCDAKITGVPARFINFITRTVIGEVWGKLLHVAEDVKTGIRPNHKNAIENQPDQYQFILERIGTMLERLKEEHDLIS